MKILIIYGSNTGNTKDLISLVKTELNAIKAKITVINAADIGSVYKFSSEYDLVILSCSTWGVEPAVMQEDFAKFWQLLDKSSITNNKFAVLGLGDSYYPHFCHALELIADDIEKYSGKLVIDVLPIVDITGEYRQEILKWLKNLKNMLLSL